MIYNYLEYGVQQTYFLSFWAIFCPTPLFTLKIKIWNKCTKCLEILCFYKCVPKMKIMMYVTWYKGWYFLPFFLPFDPTNTPKIKNFAKMRKNAWRYYHFAYVYQKPQSYEVRLLRCRVRHMIFCHFGQFFCPVTLLTN